MRRRLLARRGIARQPINLVSWLDYISICDCIAGPDYDAGVERITRMEIVFRDNAENEAPWD